MKPTRRIATALALLALGASAAPRARGQDTPQDDPFEKLKSYDFQSRQSIEASRMMIDKAQPDKAATAQIEQKLDAVLDDPAATFAGKQEAARFLWVIGSGASVPTLTKLLADDKLSDVARYALERNPDPSAAKALRTALTTTKDRTLLGVINSLGDRGDTEAVGALKPYITAPDAHVAEAAIAALGKIGTPTALAALRGLPVTNLTANQAIIRVAEHDAAMGKKAEAARVYESLAGEGRPNVVRAAALRGLANIQSPRVATIAFADLKSTDYYLQEVAARILGTMPDAKTTGQALAAWPGLPVPVQVILLTAWADRRESAATQVALGATESQDPALRQAGIHTAGLVGGGRAVPRLVDIALHGTGEDKNEARTSLANMPGADADQAILMQAQQGQPEVRAALMGVLADRPTPASKTALLNAARGSDARLAVEAIRALGRVGGPAEHGELVKVLVATNSDEVRDTAKDAVLSIGQRLDNSDRNHAAEPLLAALPGASTAAKAALLPILAEVGGDHALDELTKATSSGEAQVKQAAITALADSWQDTRPLPTLLNIAKSDGDKSVRVQALRGYLRLVDQDEQMPAEQKVVRLRDALSVAERSEEKKQALNVLRGCRVPEAVATSAKLLDDPELFGDAAGTVLDLAAPQRRNNRDMRAVKGPAVSAALDKVIALTKDDAQRAQAQKLKS